MPVTLSAWGICASLVCLSAISVKAADGPWPNTQLLEDLPNDPAASMVAGIDRFLVREIEAARLNRASHWQLETSPADNLHFLAQRLGLDARVSPESPIEYELPALTESDAWQVFAIRWPVLAHPAPQLKEHVSLWGAGLLIRPKVPQSSLLILIPDADETPEQTLGWTPPEGRQALPHASELASVTSRFLKAGFTVVIPHTISREMHTQGRAEMTRREFLAMIGSPTNRA